MNNFAEVFKYLDTDPKIILLDHWKNHDLYYYFYSPIKLFSDLYLAKFSNTLTKSFYDIYTYGIFIKQKHWIYF